MKQKNIFISGEGNRWYERNTASLVNYDFSRDLVVQEIINIIDDDQSALDIEIVASELKLLEIGCGEGGRLSYLCNNHNIECFGVDPSKKAVEKATSRGINAKVGTADGLDFDDGAFDIIIFGFCLYLCDREDLFQITKEADRVIKNKGFIIILDFFYPEKNRKNKYKYHDGIYSYKMDYRKLFCWHPFYECYKHKVMHHSKVMHESKFCYTDETDEWIAISIIRKNNNFEM